MGCLGVNGRGNVIHHQYCLMPNHWHLALWPRADGELSEFIRRVTVNRPQSQKEVDALHACIKRDRAHSEEKH
jgi:hypothetical protein